MLERAEQVRAKIEREAAAKRGAIESIFQGAPKGGDKPTRSRAEKAE